MARVDLPESRLKARRRRRRNLVAALWAVCAVGLLGSLAGLAHLPHWRVAKVEVAGVEGTEAKAVEEMVQAALEGRYFLMLPRDNVLIYPQADITAELLKEFPTFASVQVRAKDLRTLGVEIVKRTPKAVWCGVQIAAPAPCLLLDVQGAAYEPAAEFAGPVYTTYYGALAEGAAPQHYLSEEEFRSLAALVGALEEEQKGRIVSVEVDGAGDVSARFADGFELKFVLGDGSGDVFERFVLALSAEPFKDRLLTDFEYLDLRFGDRLYYKLKGE